MTHLKIAPAADRGTGDSDTGDGASIRHSYLRFGRWSQPFWTLVTGKALPGERPLLRIAPHWMALLTAGALLFFSWLLMAMLNAADTRVTVLACLLAPVFWLCLGGGWRMVQVVYGHHAIHSTLISWREEANAFVAKCLTVFALAQNQDEYEREHLDHHRRHIFTTLDDSDAALLYRFGIQPGKPLAELKRILRRTLVSPAYHFWFLKARLLSNLRRPPAWRCVALAWMAVLFVALPLAFGLLPALLAVWIPLILVYQISALLQFTTEHMWLLSEEAPKSMRAYAERCHGRFCGEMVPGGDGRPATAIAWMGWFARLLFIHIPSRVCVLVGDMPAHDWHHLCGQVRHSPAEWPSAIYERQRAIDSGLSSGMETRELWGIHNMISHVLEAMARAPALERQHEAWLRSA